MAQRALAHPWHGHRWSTPWALAVLAVVAANMLWGASIFVSKAAVEDVPPLTLALLRSVVALCVILPLLHRRGERPLRGGVATFMGLTRVALFFGCYTLGLRYTSATNASLLLNGGELVAIVLLSALVLGERLTGRRLASVAAAVAGLALVVLFGHGGPTNLGFSAFGDGLVLVAVTSWAAYVVVGRRVFAARADPMAAVAGTTLYGVLFLLPAAALEFAIRGVEIPSAGGLLLILFLGAGCTAPADVLLAYGLRRVEAGQAAILGNLSLLTSVAGATLVLHEPIAAAQLAGGALILAGICYATVERRQTAMPASAVAPARRLPSPPAFDTTGSTAEGSEPSLRACYGLGTLAAWKRNRPASRTRPT